MTHDQMQDVRDDIAFMRAMAQEGRKTPMLGGSILIAAGLIFGSASLVHYAILGGLIDLSNAAPSVVWLVALVTFILALTVLNLRIGRKPGVYAPVNKASSAAWMGVGLSIFTMSISIGVVAFKVQSELPALLFPSLIFALYGVGWAVSATMSDKKWLWLLAIGAWIAAPAIALLTGQPEQYLAYAAGLLLLTVVPGIAMVRQEPAELI